MAVFAARTISCGNCCARPTTRLYRPAITLADSLNSLVSIPDLEVVQRRLVRILCCQTGIEEISVDLSPFIEPTIVVELQLLSDDERNYVVRQALLEHQESSDPAVAVLERVDALELAVKVDDVFKRHLSFCVVAFQQGRHLLVHFLRWACRVASDFVGKLLVVSYVEPLLLAVRRPGFKKQVQMPDHRLRRLVKGMVNNVVYAAEMVSGLDDVIDSYCFVCDADGVSLKDISGLVMSQAAALDVVRVVCQVYLSTVVDASLDPSILLLTKS